MAKIDNSTSINEVSHPESNRRRADRLQERLEDYLMQQGDETALQLLHELIDEVQDRHTKQESKLQGRQLRLLSDAMPTFIGYVNTEERHEFVNKVYVEWFQIPREQILGKSVRDLIGENSYAEIEPYIRSALAGEAVRFEVTYPPGEENKRQFDVSYIPDFADDGTVLGYFTLGQDVTEIRQREALEILHMQEWARVARINTMGEMVAELAHELNQPLAAIKIYSDAVTRMLGKETTNVHDIQNALNEIRLQARRAGDVISRLREFVSKRELQPETVQLNSLIKEVLNLITVESRWHNVEVKLELDENIPEIIVDRILIEQVLLNLTRNAVEAMEAIDRDKRLMVIRTALGKYNEIEISVEDNGPGIPGEELEKIFEPFYTSKTHGMGMGLAICRSIIKAHHGRLWAIPNEHGGTTFTIILLYSPETDVDVEDKNGGTTHSIYR